MSTATENLKLDGRAWRRQPVAPGDLFGRLTVIAEIPHPKGVRRETICKCQCGNYCWAELRKLRDGTVRSCGCLLRDEPGNFRHGMCGTRTYHSWSGAISRARGTQSPEIYKDRGIGICDRWLVFENFLEDMGECPPGKSIDRINNDIGYEPGNCRWATPKEQSNNKSNNRLYEGKKICLSDEAEKHGLPVALVRHRIFKGWSLEKALNTPVLVRGKRKRTTK